ncbi:MAG: hypothetical protein R2822_24725 [Spirosomataceae bacterium]
MKHVICYLAVSLFIGSSTFGQSSKSTSIPTFSPALYEGIQWRELGPFRGGRSCTATGVRGNPNLYYMGTVGGGVWRTRDAAKLGKTSPTLISEVL